MPRAPLIENWEGETRISVSSLGNLLQERNALLADLWAGPWVEGRESTGWRRYLRGRPVAEVALVAGDGGAPTWTWWTAIAYRGTPATSEAAARDDADECLRRAGWWLSNSKH
jgi:hypothetical protein